MAINMEDADFSDIVGGGKSQRGNVRKVSKPEKLEMNDFLQPYFDRAFGRSEAYAGLKEELDAAIHEVLEDSKGNRSLKGIASALKGVMKKHGFDNQDAGKAKIDALLKYISKEELAADNFAKITPEVEAALQEYIDDAVEGFGQPRAVDPLSGKAKAATGAAVADPEELVRLRQQAKGFRDEARKGEVTNAKMREALRAQTIEAKAGREAVAGYKNLTSLLGDETLSQLETLDDSILKKAGVPKQGWEAARMLHAQKRSIGTLTQEKQGQQSLIDALTAARKTEAATPVTPAGPTAPVAPTGIDPTAAKTGVSKWQTAKDGIKRFLMPTEELAAAGTGIRDIGRSFTPESRQLQQLSKTMAGGGLAIEAETLAGTDQKAIQELLEWMGAPGKAGGTTKAGRTAMNATQSQLQGLAPEALKKLAGGAPIGTRSLARNVGKIAVGGAAGLTSLPIQLAAMLGVPWVQGMMEDFTDTPVTFQSKANRQLQGLQPGLDDAILAMKTQEFQQENAMNAMRENPDMMAAAMRQSRMSQAQKTGLTPSEHRIGGQGPFPGNPLDLLGVE